MNELLVIRGVERIFVASTIPLLMWIGYRLFVLGATGQMTLSAKTHTVQGKITNLSPGALCFLLAISLGAYDLAKGGTYDATVSTPPQAAAAVPVSAPSATTQSTAEESVSKHTLPAPQKPINEKSQSATISQVHVNLDTGTANAVPTSVFIRRALSDFEICQSPTRTADACLTTLNSKLKRIPTAAELAEIEKLERNHADAQDEALLRRYRQDFVKE
jgi:hypothetical protein